jgi:hypothetical protein
VSRLPTKPNIFGGQSSILVSKLIWNSPNAVLICRRKTSQPPDYNQHTIHDLLHIATITSSAKENTQTETMSKEESEPIMTTPVKRPLTTLNDVTPSPLRKRLAPTSSSDTESSSSDSQRYVIQRCNAWSEDSDEEAAIAQKSRKRARVSFNLPLTRRTMFHTASFSLVTPIHWNDLIPATDNLQNVISRAAEKERS